MSQPNRGSFRQRAREARGRPGTAVQGVLASSVVGSMSLVAGIFLLPIVANAVGPGPYGMWLFLITLTSLVGYGDLGVYAAIVHFGSQSRENTDSYSMSELMTAGVIWSILVALVVVPIYLWLGLLFAQPRADEVGLPHDATTILVVLGAVVAALAIARPFGGALIGAGYLLKDRQAQLASLIFRVVGSLIAALGFKSIIAVAVVETIATALPSLIIIPFVFQRIAQLRVRRGSLRPLRMMLGYSVKSLLTSLPQTVVTGGATIVLGLVQGPVQVTYFNFAYRIAGGLRTVMGWTVEPFRSAFSRLAAIDRAAHLRSAYHLAFASAAIIGAGAGLLGVSATWLVGLWVGGSMPADLIAATAVILMAGVFLESLVYPFVLAGDTAGFPGAFFGPQALWAVLFLAIAPWLGTVWSAVGVAAAVTVPLLITGPYHLIIARKRLGLSAGAWWRETFGPTMALILPALLLGVLADWLVGPTAPWAPTVVYSVIGLITFALLRRRLPVGDLVDTLKLRM